ncbi:MAG: 16S rRNA (cytosine(967)-C(5))-methyltransferase RsmB [Clostridiaceae bacterium]|nr:16S rRNA (cytosine(967)-C(5))-methyltransferase RsmB [Clostridiaceae bacterium]
MAAKRPKRTADPARLAAVKVLNQVMEENAFSNESAAWHLAAPGLDARDRAFASALIFGTLSRLPLIDDLLSQVSSRPLEGLDPWVRTILRAGVWQLYFSYQVTVAAACDESVRLARFLAGEKVTGFVNGILRRLARSRPEPKEDDRAALEAGLTPLLYDLLEGWYGREIALAIGRSSLEAPGHLAIRFNSCKAHAWEEWLKGGEAESFKAEKLPWPACAYSLQPAGRSVTSSNAYKEGLFTMQSQAAMMAGILSGAGEGDRILDLCAAPGGKTGHLAELSGCAGTITACDISPAKVALLDETLARLGHGFVNTCVHDASLPSSEFTAAFDRVICDVPCSGLGLLLKRPEIRSRVTQEVIDRLRAVQRSILESGSLAVAPGGRLLYSTCTLNPEENEEQIVGFLGSQSGEDFELEDLGEETGAALRGAIKPPLSDRLPAAVLFMPHRDQTDGFFVARLRRKPV